jgi:purine nucleoside permease
MSDAKLLEGILAIEAEAGKLDVERLARALMDAANNGDRPITETAYATAIRVLEALE